MTHRSDESSPQVCFSFDSRGLHAPACCCYARCTLFIRSFLSCFAVLLLASACDKSDVAAAPRKTDQRWASLGLPESRVVKVLADSNEHGYFANYSGSDPKAFLVDISSRIEAAGYTKVCTAFEGWVVGFKKGNETIGVKVDALGDEVGLSVFDDESREELILGVCTGKYSLGESKTAEEHGAETRQVRETWPDP